MRRIVLAALAAMLVGLSSTATHAATPKPLQYVAMGDSYSAASGVLPPDPTAPPNCLRSTLNYGHLIAAATHAAYTDVTCGGAQTKDYFSGQYPGVAPQLNAVTASTQLVTMTIGGNDGNVFIGAILECGAAGLSTAGQGSPCQDTYGNSFVDTIEQSTYPALVKALQAVHAKAPHARVAILGYPWILPRTTGCFPVVPVATGDVPYLRHVEAALNSAVKRAAKVTGSTYVDLSVVSAGHDACQASGVRWVEPVLTGTNPVIVHPNALGEQNLAAQTMKVLHLP